MPTLDFLGTARDYDAWRDELLVACGVDDGLIALDRERRWPVPTWKLTPILGTLGIRAESVDLTEYIRKCGAENGGEHPIRRLGTSLVWYPTDIDVLIQVLGTMRPHWTDAAAARQAAGRPFEAERPRFLEHFRRHRTFCERYGFEEPHRVHDLIVAGRHPIPASGGDDVPYTLPKHELDFAREVWLLGRRPLTRMVSAQQKLAFYGPYGAVQPPPVLRESSDPSDASEAGERLQEPPSASGGRWVSSRRRRRARLLSIAGGESDE